MKSRWFHMLIFLPLLLAAGCISGVGLDTPASGLVLTVRCEDPELTKATTPEDGETRFNENLIKSVDFFFYRGNAPAGDAAAVYHRRVDLEEDPVSHIGGRWEATFTLVLKRAEAEQIFPANNSSATVYAVVNYNGDLTSNGTSMDELADTVIETNFAETESDYVQNSFLMDGKTTVTYQESSDINVSGTIEVRRFAAKLTASVSVASEVTLTHTNPDDDPAEIWEPVLHTMRLYLVDGVKQVTLGTVSSTLKSGDVFFSYSAESSKRPFLMEDGTDEGTPYLDPTIIDEKTYYNTYPMYSYPVQWSTGRPDYTQALPKQPYLKLEMDWRRKEVNDYSYDRRKYYYKIVLPTNSLERNNWYHFNIDVSILGSETDESKAVLTPTCYILDWQNKSVPIDKYAVISKARYLSVDTNPKYLNNVEALSIPFLSSHDVVVVKGSEKARRPYYGEFASTEVGTYSTKYHAWVEEIDGAYYLVYNGQDQAVDGNGNPIGKVDYEPARWITNTSTTIEFTHTLQNVYTKNDFDYSPYTIEFDIVHNDLKKGVYPYDEYLKHITIIQYPGIYIESCMNSDSEIRATSNNNGKPYYHSPNDPDKPWLNYPWGYVYIDGGRFIRTGNDSTEPYKKLTTDNNRAEYQWRTVWYTGGGRDIFRINVTVLPNSEFIIGDPRTDGYDTTEPVLGYSFENNGSGAGDAVLVNKIGDASNFTHAPVVNGDVNTPMSLTGDTRPLMYYRPTEKSSRTEKMLAPSYRFSTKLGGTEFGNLDEAHAKWRCAGYQEDGFPGGRWRIPTKSEIRFIAQLSANGVFEPMFKGDYWSANGAVNVSGSTVKDSDATTALLRCVYDSWYWGDEQWVGQSGKHDQFVWGDRP